MTFSIPVHKLKGIHVIQLPEHCSPLNNAAEKFFWCQVKKFIKSFSLIQRQFPSPGNAGGQCVLNSKYISAHLLHSVGVYLLDGGGAADEDGGDEVRHALEHVLDPGGRGVKAISQ